jgi:23S rRNA pseudouridine1911/1915/1917 synthase
MKRHWSISAGDAGLRLDAFLRRQLPFLSRREMANALSARCFRINARTARKGDRLAQGDVVKFTGSPARLARAPIPNPGLHVPLVYEDAAVLALNKPAGMNCHGFSGRDDASLANFLLARWPELIGVGKDRWQPGLVHRIDRDTSGLVLVAKQQAGFDELRAQFRRRAVKKKYLALVQGSTPRQGKIALPLAHDPKDPRKMLPLAPQQGATGSKVWPALTRYRKVGERDSLSFLQLEMETGVTHQLRAHLAAIGHPIVGDLLYGAAPQKGLGLARHFLHASELRFRHPISRKLLSLQAPMPRELNAVLKRLKLQLDAADK